MSFKPAVSLTEQIANHLGDEIIHGRLKPHERIQELRVAKALGVSRGSVREALLILESRHLIAIVPRKGAMVSGLSKSEVDDLLDFAAELLTLLFTRVAASARRRRDEGALEGFKAALDNMDKAAAATDSAAFLGAKRAFIEAAFPLARNSYLESVLRDLMPASERVTFRVMHRQSTDLRDGVRFFGALLKAVGEDDAARIHELVHAHLKLERKLALEAA